MNFNHFYVATIHLDHLHVAIIHFPIALAIAAAAADLLWLITRRSFFGSASLYCLAAALIVTPAALLTGDMLSEDQEVFPPSTNPFVLDQVEDHEHAAFTSFGIMIAAVAVRWLRAWKPAKWQPWVYGLLMLALVVAISITGDLGGKLVYGRIGSAKRVRARSTEACACRQSGHKRRGRRPADGRCWPSGRFCSWPAWPCGWPTPLGDDPAAGLAGLLVNFIFFTPLAAGMVVWPAVLMAARASGWTGPADGRWRAWLSPRSRWRPSSSSGSAASTGPRGCTRRTCRTPRG